jgi:hypothetical protein
MRQAWMLAAILAAMVAATASAYAVDRQAVLADMKAAIDRLSKIEADAYQIRSQNLAAGDVYVVDAPTHVCPAMNPGEQGNGRLRPVTLSPGDSFRVDSVHKDGAWTWYRCTVASGAQVGVWGYVSALALNGQNGKAECAAAQVACDAIMERERQRIYGAVAATHGITQDEAEAIYLSSLGGNP